MHKEPDNRDERLMTLVEAASALPEGQREAWLRACCPDDSDLAREVLLRIGWEREMQGFLTEPVLGVPEVVELEPGQALGDRLRVVRKIAAGGMATVYMAEDQNIGAVAIKVPKPVFRKRLLAEARFALQVTHPHICRVHSVETVPSECGEIEFLKMEYLDGETLQDRLRREGPLPLKELGQLAQQLCAGLGEAHNRGVVHGDLKGSNVILTRRNDEFRAVITDFGLARAAGLGVAGVTASLRGTPEFIAPEVWNGDAFSTASDLYALGVLLYETATGVRPFADDPSRRQRLGVAAPRRLRRDLPHRWSLMITSCVKVDSSRRPEGALDVARAFTPFWNASSGTILLAVALILSAAGAGLTFHSDGTLPDPIRIALLPADADHDSALFAGGTLRELATTLPSYRAMGGLVVVIPTIEELGKDPADTYTKAGATHLIRTRFQSVGKDTRAYLSVSDVRSGQELRSFSGNYTRASIGSLPQAMVSAVSAALQLQGSPRKSHITPAARSEYLRGQGELQKLQPDFDAAIAAFQAASEMDPEASLPWAGLTVALERKYELKDDPVFLERARSALQEALSRDPDNVAVHLAAGPVYRSSGWPERAASEYSRVLQIEAGSIEAMRLLGQAYVDMGLPVDAVKTWQDAISQLPNYYPTRVDLGRYYYYRARYKDAEEQFRRVTELAPDLAAGHHSLGAVYADLGRFDEAAQSFRRALALRLHADTLAGLGSVMSYQKRPQDAAYFYEQAKVVGPINYILLMNLGEVYRRLGRKADSQRNYAEALALADRDLRERPRDGYVRAFVAYISARLGDRSRAERELAQALRLSPDEAKVKRTAIMTYLALDRTKDIEVVLAGEPVLREEMARQPDLSEFMSKAGLTK